MFGFQGRYYLLDCAFDRAADDYAPEYDVFEIDLPSLEALPDDFRDLRRKTSLGRVPVEALRLDPTRRQLLDPSILDSLKP